MTNQQSGPHRNPDHAVDPRITDWVNRVAGPVNWRDLSSADAAQRWEQLREWVGWFRLEFGYDHRVVPPCWYRHSALVSVLSALRDHWLVAYDPLNTSAGAAEWHRSLLQLEQRLRDWASRTGCRADVHRSDVVADYPDDSQTWRQHVRDDIGRRHQREIRAAVDDDLT